MNEPKFTPGPWSIHVQESTGELLVTAQNYPLAICNVNDYGGMPASDNARLIAAAPDLLEALRGAMRISDLWLPEQCEPEHEDKLKALHAMKLCFETAIAKALGE
jgi:hypothetical protein